MEPYDLLTTQFFNNSQEIDMEFLSKQFGTNKGAVNLVLQTPESVSHGYDASNTSEFKVQPLPFPPDGQFHEYRFDWTPDRVAFYVDGRILHEIKQMVPTMGGRMFMNHWSNGDRAWTAGPPSDDTALTVSYIKAYFNSTDAYRIKAHKERCAKYDYRKVCGIPEQMIAPDPSMGPDGAKTYFFSQDGNKARYQTTYDTTNDATSLSASSCLLLIFAFTSAVLAI
jgi:beta-glucanase (GH16 family)